MSSKKKTFVLKDSPPEVVAAAGTEPKGRYYSKESSEQPGAIHIDDIVLGMKYASLAITDDKEGTLEKVGKANPWHIQALKIITGSKEEAHKPLSTILSKHMNLTCDEIIDVNGVTPGGHPLDTQGYIAHNDEVIVLAFRCTTSAKDWLTNINTTSSEWEIEEDLAQGYSGFMSGLEGLCCTNGEYKPRVHTGFYNNFLSAAPFIKTHIGPLLKPDQPPRKLFVVGHSLGAGIATLAACYFLLEMDWADSPHKMICVTAGSPRSCQQSMKDVIDEKMKVLRPLDKAVMCRLVRDRDVVPTLPPAFFGFAHLDKLVYITDDGEILINPKVDDAQIIDENEMNDLVNDKSVTEMEDSESSDDEDENAPVSKYDRMVAKIPQPFRDHMPDFYLKPVIKMFEKEHNIEPTVFTTESDDEGENKPTEPSSTAEDNDGDNDPAVASERAPDSDPDKKEDIDDKENQGNSNTSPKKSKTSSLKKLTKMFSRKKKVNAETTSS